MAPPDMKWSLNLASPEHARQLKYLHIFKFAYLYYPLSRILNFWYRSRAQAVKQSVDSHSSFD